MATQLIDDARIQRLNDAETRDGRFVLYWMQQSQRTSCNHALEFAVRRANELGSRLLVAFALTDDYPDANLRHFTFLLQGLQQVEQELQRRNIRFALRIGDSVDVIADLASDAREVICDRGYLRHQVSWRRDIAERFDGPVWQIESDVIVPVEVASHKREYAARTIRSKINDASEKFVHDLKTTPLENDSSSLDISGEDLSDLSKLLDQLSIDTDVAEVDEFTGGTSQAKARLRQFLQDGLNDYRQDLSLCSPHVSMLSPWLHFGQISPLEIALAVQSAKGTATEAKDEYLEELLVRRELAINFVHYCADYDSLQCLPDWAAETLEEHEDDERPYHYTATELENAETHDAAWNAAMLEMKHRGYLHNYMRMYWGKKIVEWTNTTAHAYRTALDLNNKYFLDGRDANSWTNVAWLFGLHDRAHQERDVFGKVRYMSDGGLKRKFDIDRWVQSVEERWQVSAATS